MEFEQYLQQKNFVPKTITRHQSEADKYNKWLKAKGTDIDNATRKDLLDYLQYTKESRNLCNATQEKILERLKNYYGWLSQYRHLPDCTHFIKIRGVQRKHLRPLFTPDELAELCDLYYAHTQEYTPTAKELRFYPDYQKLLQGRYIALTLTAYQALQVQEIEALTAADFDIRKATVHIHASRRGTDRTLPLDASQIGALIQYYADGADTPLIPNSNHFERLSQTLKSLHPKYLDYRQIRASKITHWLKGCGLRKAQHLAGHKNIQSTEKYLANDIEALQNDMDSFHPLR